MVCVSVECKCTLLFISIMFISKLAEFRKSSISLGWKIRKNSTNLAKVNPSENDINVLIEKMSTCEKTSKFPI